MKGMTTSTLALIGIFTAVSAFGEFRFNEGYETDVPRRARPATSSVNAEKPAATAPASSLAAAPESTAIAAAVTSTTGAIAASGSSGQSLILLLWVLTMAMFVGFEIIARVPAILHTPLMSGSNAISGISVIGAILLMRTAEGTQLSGVSIFVGIFAIALGTVNVVGGYLVTDRMLKMFKKK